MWAAWDGSAHHGGHLFLRRPGLGLGSIIQSPMEEGLLSLKIYYILESILFILTLIGEQAFSRQCQEVPADHSKALGEDAWMPSPAAGPPFPLCVPRHRDPEAC